MVSMACEYGSRLASTSLVDDEFDQLVLNKHIEGTADTVGTCSEELALAELSLRELADEHRLITFGLSWSRASSIESPVTPASVARCRRPPTFMPCVRWRLRA